MNPTFDTDLQSGLDSVIAHLAEELSSMRSNRPSVDLVERISLVYYDQPMNIRQLGSLSIEPPRTVLITVWDQNAVAPVVKAIQDAQVGLSVSNDGLTIRASMAELTSERREELAKSIKKTSEGTRITIRNERDDTMKKIKAAKEAKEITEDDERTIKDKVQKVVDAANKRVDELTEQKLTSIAG
jgi:ribosome recycling factor